MMKFEKLNVFFISFMSLVGYIIGGAILHIKYLNEYYETREYARFIIRFFAGFTMACFILSLLTNTPHKVNN